MFKTDKPLTHRPATGLLLTVLLLGVFAFAALPVAGPAHAARPAVKAKINLGVKNFDEEYIIADMYQLLLQKSGFRVQQHVLGTTALLHGALLKGSIDMYPEYTGTGLTVVLQRKSISNAKKAYKVVKAQYQKKFHLTWLAQTPMNDTNTIVVTSATASTNHLRTLSDLAKVSKNFTFAALAECKGRPDCELGLTKAYGITFKSAIYVASTDLTIQALKAGQADAAEVFSTDARIKANNFVSLTDNKAAVFPADHIAPVVRDSILRKYPKISKTLNRLAPYITTKLIISLNGQYDIQHKDAMVIARTFLKSKHLI